MSHSIALPTWDALSTRRWVFESAQHESGNRFPAFGYFTLFVHPGCHLSDGAAWHLTSVVESCHEWNSDKAVLKIHLPQLYCWTLLSVSLDLLSTKAKHHFLLPSQRRKVSDFVLPPSKSTSFNMSVVCFKYFHDLDGCLGPSGVLTLLENTPLLEVDESTWVIFAGA